MKAAFKDEKGKIVKKPVLFDRCVKIEIAKASDGNNKALTIEYNPNYTNEDEIKAATGLFPWSDKPSRNIVQRGTLCAKIEGTITELPKASNKNHTPGYTAILKIYNDFANIVATVLDVRNKFMIDFADKSASDTQKKSALQNYLQNKYWAVVWVGYWNEETKQADYTKIFTGCINNHYSYRKGAELVTELQCANVYPDKQTTEQLNIMFDAGSSAVKQMNNEEEKTEDPLVNEEPAKGWYGLAATAIRRLSTEKAYVLFNFAKMSPVPVRVKESDRENSDWFAITSDDSVIQTQMYRGKDDPIISGYYSSSRDFDRVWEDVISIFPGQKVTYKIEDDWTRGIRVYKIIPLGNIKSPKKIGGTIHYIYDYQNLLDSPMMSPTGGLTVNMLLRPEMRAWDYLELHLTPQNKYGTSIGINGSGSETYPLLYGSASQIIKGVEGAKGVSASYKTGGSIFNKPFLIYKIVHAFSTHGSTWKTTVTTSPLIYTGA